jgi:lysophospholipase L1-like esterase
VRLRVKGKQLAATIDEKGNDFWQVVVDGVPMHVLSPKQGVDTYTIDLGADAVHDVRLVKRTEAFVGTTHFRGFEVPNGELLKAKGKRRHLEFVGDSITCGFGNEGKNQDEAFRNDTENAYQSYASIASRALDADVTLIAWSGRKMWPNNTVPEIYDRTLPTDPTAVYDFRGPKPNAVIINLATNDFGQANPEEKGWTGAYEAFIRRVWQKYPRAHVYMTLGGMMTDGYPAGNNALTTLRGYLSKIEARMKDRRLHVIEFDQQKIEDGIGSGWHPNVVTHQKMAARLEAALRKDLRWK